MATQCPRVELDHPVSRRYKYEGLTHKSGVGMRLTPSPCKTTLVKKPQEMQAGWNENR